MTERDFTEWDDPVFRRQYYEGEMARMTELNGMPRTVQAIKYAKEVVSGLVPFQPVDLQRLQTNLLEMGFDSGEPNGIIFEALSILTSVYLRQQKRWDLMISEWTV